MAIRMILMLALVGLVLGGLIGFESFVRPGLIRAAISKSGNPPQTVSTMVAGEQPWQETVSAVGSLRAVNGADLSSELAGVVGEIDFESGQDVERGAVLLKLRADDDIAKLRSLQAMAELAQVTLDRDRQQLKAQAVSQATIDTDVASLKNARAQVDQQQAIVDKKVIRAPFAGRLGIRAVDLGQYLAAGTAIVTLQALDPIYLDFNVPQQALKELHVGQKVTVRVDTYPGERFAGEIGSFNAKVDPSTRNIQVRARLPNPDKRLLPGMYATAEISTGSPERHVTLPQTAIAYNSFGATVYLVEDRGKDAEGKPRLAARQTFVTAGPTRGDQVAILAGVKPGDMVVTSGQIKLRNGAPIIVNNRVEPANDPAPRPVEQ